MCPRNMIVCMWARVNAHIIVSVSTHLCLCVSMYLCMCSCVCVCVCVCLSMCVCVCSFMHACICGCLSLIYFADLQFIYQILLLQVKVLLSVGLLSTLITGGTISIHLQMHLEERVLPFSRYPKRIGLPQFRWNYTLLLVPSFPQQLSLLLLILELVL